MASNSTYLSGGAGGPNSSLNDIVVNSSLTATATEFVPGAASNRVHQHHGRGGLTTAFESGFRNNGDTMTGNPNGAPNNDYKINRSDRRYPKSQNREWWKRKNIEQGSEERDLLRPSSQSSVHDREKASPSSSHRPNGRKPHGDRNWKDRSSASVGNYQHSSKDSRLITETDGNLEESPQNAAGGSKQKMFYKDNAPGYRRGRDNNGKKNQAREQEKTLVRAASPERTFDGDQDRTHKRNQERDCDEDHGQALEGTYPRAQGRYRDREWTRNTERGRDLENAQGRAKHSERSWIQSKNYDREHHLARAEFRTSEWNPDRYYERQRDVNRNGQRDYRYDHARGDRASERHPDSTYFERYEERGSNRQSERNCDNYQDRYLNRASDQNYDRFDWSKDRYYEQGRVSSDCEPERDFDRGYRKRNKALTEYSKTDYNRKRNNNSNHTEGGISSTHNISVQETFSNNKFRMNYNETDSKQKSFSYGKGLEREQNGPCGRQLNLLKNIDGDDISQRERLTDQLCRGALECLVCCDRVRQHDSVWSCTNCYHVLHLRCVIKWAKSSKADSGWRCPACQNISKAVPSQYRCFCGKMSNPLWNRQDTPHTCGEMCGKSRELQRPNCTHRCTLLCHPGPCPPCLALVTRKCGCGKTTQTVKCGLEKPLLCGSECEKSLNCGVHSCTKSCHVGPCEPCDHKINQVCHCSKLKREVDCVIENLSIDEFCCGEICGRKLACDNHSCESICHPGPCTPCQLTPDVVTHCPCGQTKLGTEQKRDSCTDPIPTCGKACEKKLKCGQPSNPHTCKVECHVGDCPPCPLSTLVRCRCGYMDREISCDQLTTKADDARCEKKCTKKRSCAKHKCNQLCCIEIEHPCPLPCNHMLSCGQHRCEELCHRGHCQPCWRTSFEELLCECGAEVLYPPIPCGTKPPPCSRPCSRQHNCEHPALHTCHSELNCPPCTVLTQKWCHGRHEMRKIIPCHQKEFSCGLPCNKELPCGRHRCIQPCHKDECLRIGTVCTQPCPAPRPACQHPCSAPCHDGSCPDSPCKETVRVTCECGHRSAMRQCAENTQEYQRIATSLLASKMADVQLGHSIDIRDIMGNASTRKLYLKSLECNDECKIIERNRRMAIGLQIRNPDLSAKLTPRYSEFMRGWAKKDPHFCHMVHDKLTELVKLAKESKQKSRSHSFEVMNRDKRQFVHEYCEHFGCESVAYDQEPKRNVVATAQKDKAWLPSVGLVELVQREAGQRKVPGPMLSSNKKPIPRVMECLPNKWSSKPVVGSSSSAVGPSSVYNMTPSNLGSDGNTAGSSHSVIDHFNS